MCGHLCHVDGSVNNEHEVNYQVTFFRLFRRLFLSHPRSQSRRQQVIRSRQTNRHSARLVKFKVLKGNMVATIHRRQRNVQGGKHDVHVASSARSSTVGVKRLPIPKRVLFRSAQVARHFHAEFRFSVGTIRVASKCVRQLRRGLIYVSVVAIQID